MFQHTYYLNQRLMMNFEVEPNQETMVEMGVKMTLFVVFITSFETKHFITRATSAFDNSP